MARPTKKTQELEAKICELLAAGNNRKTAVGAIGIHYSTFCDWLREFPEFSEAVERAEHEAEAYYVSVLHRCAQKDWRAALEWLKRQRRAEWGDRIDIGNISDEQLLRMLDISLAEDNVGLSATDLLKLTNYATDVSRVI
jgi:hypothetical protein